MVRLNLLKYSETQSQRLPPSLSAYVAKFELVKSFLGYEYSKTTHEAFKDGLYWKYRETGEFLPTELGSQLDSRIFYINKENNDYSNWTRRG